MDGSHSHQSIGPLEADFSAVHRPGNMLWMAAVQRTGGLHNPGDTTTQQLVA